MNRQVHKAAQEMKTALDEAMKEESEEFEELDADHYEIENRIRNLSWTVSGDYSLKLKLDTESFRRSPYVSFYDAVKQGAFSRFFDRNAFGLYLVKKVYYGADEQALASIAQMAVDSAVKNKISAERAGVSEIRRKAYEETMERDFTGLASSYYGQIYLTLMQQAVRGEASVPVTDRMQKALDSLSSLGETRDVMDIIRVVDELYNWVVDPYFERNHGDLEKVLAVTLEELQEFSWKDYLEEEAYADTLESYMEQLSQAAMETAEMKKEPQEQKKRRMKRVMIDEETAAKMYSYIELNYGRSYLNAGEQERLNRSLCRGAHADCSLFYTDGILNNMVRRNYQSEYARRSRSENLKVYGHHMRISRRNIEQLAHTLQRSLTLRAERECIRSEYGNILPSQLWKVGRSRDPKLFEREIRKDSSEFVVHVLIDASGSQRSRQSLVALQGFIISEALSIVRIPHRVMGFCTFWDYTVMQRYRDYDDPREANRRIFEFHASSNNRDGLAIRAAAASLEERPEENKVLIVLSDGRPNDIIVNRPNARNPAPYAGDYAVKDTASEVRKVRARGISVLGVFAGEEQDLMAEKRIFGRDFAYIRNIMNFSSVVGLYLRRQLDET